MLSQSLGQVFTTTDCSRDCTRAQTTGHSLLLPQEQGYVTLLSINIAALIFYLVDPMEHSHKQHKQRAPSLTGEEQRTAPPPLPPSQLDKAVEILTSSIK